MICDICDPMKGLLFQLRQKIGQSKWKNKKEKVNKSNSMWEGDGTIGSSARSNQLGAPFHLHFCLNPPSTWFSLPSFHSHSPSWFFLFLCQKGPSHLPCNFVFNAFQVLSLFAIFYPLFLYPYYLLHFHPHLVSLCDGLSFFAIAANLSSLYDCTAETPRKKEQPTKQARDKWVERLVMQK